MKIIYIVLLLIIISTIGIGARHYLTSNRNFIDKDELAIIFYENRELLINIKDGLFASDFVPDRQNALFLFFDYENKQLFASNDPYGERLQSIKNIHSYAIEYFMLVDENLNPDIGFREIRDRGVIIEFGFRSARGPHAGIMYKTMPDNLWRETHLEGNWYVFWMASISG